MKFLRRLRLLFGSPLAVQLQHELDMANSLLFELRRELGAYRSYYSKHKCQPVAVETLILEREALRKEVSRLNRALHDAHKQPPESVDDLTRSSRRKSV